MSFLLVILLMIINSARGPDNGSVLVGRNGSHDQIVGKADDTVDVQERVPDAVASSTTNSAEKFIAPNAELASADAAPAAGSSADAKSMPGASHAAVESKRLPPATGVTDEDPDEVAAATEDLQYVADGTEGTLRDEMPAYERVLRWVVDQSYQRLAARSVHRKPSYSQVVAASNDDRGKLFQFDLHVRLVRKYDSLSKFYNQDEDSHDPVQLYEMWGSTEESRGRLYQLIVYDPPAGLPIGPGVQEDVRFAGYYFKLQGYKPAKALPGASDELAPTYIGRVAWIKRPAVVWVHQADIWWIAGIGGAVLAVFVGWLTWLLVRKPRPSVARDSIGLSSHKTAAIDDWLSESPGPAVHQAGQSEAADRSEQDPINSSSQNGHTNGNAAAFIERPGREHS